MLRVFDVQSDLRLPALSLHFSPKQIGKNISPELITNPNLTEPFSGSKPNKTPITLQQMSPITVANISRDIPTPSPPDSHSGDNNQTHQHGNANRHRPPQSNLQGIKRSHRAINHRAERKENDKNRHH